MDKLYKLQFETKNLKKIEIQGEIDKNLLEKIINYNLFFYYLNKKEFKDKNKRCRETIYYDNILFFDGIISENIGSGRLYDILRPGTLLYEGAFINGLPGGNGTGYLIDLKISGSWLNGYILKNNLNNYKVLNIKTIEDWNIYKKNLEENYKFSQVHFSNKLNPMFEIIRDNYNLVNFENINNSDKLETLLKNDGKKIFYYDNVWQTPIITEKRVYELFSNKEIPDNYFAFPWATLLDEINCMKKTNLVNILYDFKVDVSSCFTVCQSINYRRLLPLFKKIGITHVFASHKTILDYLLEDKYKIKIISMSLYPVNYNKVDNILFCKKFLCSFIGAYDDKYYISDIRLRIKNLSKFPDCFIEIKNDWHFNKIVYDYQIKKIKKDENTLILNKEEEKKFIEIMESSIFSICPSGTGPNSIRLWESLSYGSIPVILSNNQELPLFINWEDIVIFYDDREEDMDKLHEYLLNLSLNNNKIIEMKEKGKKIFNSFFSQELFTEQIKSFYNLF